MNTVTSCRLCGCSDIPIIWDFGKSPLANAFKSKEELNDVELEFPLRYFKCSNCHSVQLKDEVSSDILFKEYLYESPPNLIPHFNEMAKTTSEYIGMKPDDWVFDIGSNTGILLSEYRKLGYNIMGIEPADNIAKKARANNIPTMTSFFDPNTAEEINLMSQSPKLVTCCNCFAHISDLNEVIISLKVILPKQSYFIFENAYLLNTIENLDFGQCYFEHFYLHSVTPLSTLFEKHGLELFKIEYNEVQMGSIRGYVRWKENQTIPVDNSVVNAINNECQLGLFDLDIYQDFKHDIGRIKSSVQDTLKIFKENRSKIAVYAWPAKMTLLNKYFGIEKYLDYIVEESSLKIGKYAPGTKLEIKDVDYFKQNDPDYCLLGAYNFEKDIKTKHNWYKGAWINPLKL